MKYLKQLKLLGSGQGNGTMRYRLTHPAQVREKYHSEPKPMQAGDYLPEVSQAELKRLQDLGFVVEKPEKPSEPKG
jgi:hypothetical protein